MQFIYSAKCVTVCCKSPFTVLLIDTVFQLYLLLLLVMLPCFLHVDVKRYVKNQGNEEIQAVQMYIKVGCKLKLSTRI